MAAIPDYIKDELGTDTPSEFGQKVETQEHPAIAEISKESEGEKTEELPADEPITLPAVIEPAVVEILTRRDYVDVEGVKYVARGNRMYLAVQKGEDILETLVSGLIVVVADARDENSSSWGKVIRFEDRDGVLKQMYLSNPDITSNGKAVIKRLSNEGLVTATPIGMEEALLHYLNLAPPLEKERAICSDRIGWHDDAYLLHDNTVIGKSDKRFVYTGSPVGNQNATKGTIDEWKNNVAALCRGNSLLLLSVSVSFASALLTMLDQESGGYHIFGESSTGKSTSLYVAASVHGEPKPLIGSWNTTKSGAEGRAKKYNDSLMINDELHMSKPQDAGDLAYMYMNGVGKQRANVLGDARNLAGWRLNCLSSGEVSFAAFIESGGTKARAGQAVRMLDISADMGLGMGAFEDIHGAKDSYTFTEQIKKACSSYYGTPIRAFIECLIDQMDLLGPGFEEARDRFFEEFVPVGSSSQVQRVATKMALVAMAGEIATAMEITGWEPDEAYDAVGGCFQRWLSSRGTTGQQESEIAIEQVKDFLQRHGMSRFIPVTELPTGGYRQDGPDRTISNVAGFRVEKTGNIYEYIVYPTVYSGEMCQGLNPATVTKALVERDFLMLEGKEKKPQVRRRLPGSVNQQRVYHFTSAIMSDEDGPDTEATADEETVE